MYLISCCKCWTTAASPTARAARVDFKNTVIILTSNLGSGTDSGRIWRRRRAEGKNELSCTRPRNAIDQLLKRQFRPEFLNRLDDIVYYKSLTKQEIGSIVDLMATRPAQAPGRQAAADLVVTEAAKNSIIDWRLRPDLRRPPAEAVHPVPRGDDDRERDHRRCPQRRG